MSTVGNDEKKINYSKKPQIFKQKEKTPIFEYDLNKAPDFSLKKKTHHK